MKEFLRESGFSEAVGRAELEVRFSQRARRCAPEAGAGRRWAADFRPPAPLGAIYFREIPHSLILFNSVL
jgi:hypothetical protein